MRCFWAMRVFVDSSKAHKGAVLRAFTGVLCCALCLLLLFSTLLSSQYKRRWSDGRTVIFYFSEPVSADMVIPIFEDLYSDHILNGYSVYTPIDVVSNALLVSTHGRIHSDSKAKLLDDYPSNHLQDYPNDNVFLMDTQFIPSEFDFKTRSYKIRIDHMELSCVGIADGNYYPIHAKLGMQKPDYIPQIRNMSGDPITMRKDFVTMLLKEWMHGQNDELLYNDPEFRNKYINSDEFQRYLRTFLAYIQVPSKLLIDNGQYVSSVCVSTINPSDDKLIGTISATLDKWQHSIESTTEQKYLGLFIDSMVAEGLLYWGGMLIAMINVLQLFAGWLAVLRQPASVLRSLGMSKYTLFISLWFMCLIAASVGFCVAFIIYQLLLPIGESVRFIAQLSENMVGWIFVTYFGIVGIVSSLLVCKVARIRPSAGRGR